MAGSDKKPWKGKYKKHNVCKEGCCPPPPSFNSGLDGAYCGFVTPNGNIESLENNPADPPNPPLPSPSNLENSNSNSSGIDTNPVTNIIDTPTITGNVIVDQQEQVNDNYKKGKTVEEKVITVKKVVAAKKDDAAKQVPPVKRDVTVEQNLTIKNQNDVPKDLKDNQICTNPKCKDGACAATRLEVNSETCTDNCCAELCSDENCSGCDHDHGKTARNTFLGIAGVLILAIIGYLSYIKMKTRRTKASKTLSSTDL